jgi:3',5'-cyclic AMP phosphodiesterase CpdA
MKLNLRKSKLGILLGLMLVFLLATSQAQAFRFVVLADSPHIMDKWPNQAINKECLEYIRDQIMGLNPKPDMVFFLGDLVTRAYRSSDEHRFIPDWKEIMRPLPQKSIKVYVAIGNRDLYGPDGWPPLKKLEGEFRHYFSVPPFAMPDNGPVNYKRLAYSFTYDNAFFVVLDTFGFKRDGTNWDVGLDEEQLAWFQNQAQNSAAKFKFVLSHGPALSAEGLWNWKEKPTMQSMWQIMERFNFSAYFCGHEHIFSHWLIDKSVDPTIIRPMTQILAGTAGAYPDDPSSIKKKELIKKANIWLGYNYVVVDVNHGQAVQRAYGVTKETGVYKSKLLDTCTLK